MGQAKLRGNREQRVAQAMERVEASRPAKLVCNTCQADVTDLHAVSTRGLRGIESIWMGKCQCGHTTFAANGDPAAVQAFFDALGEGDDVILGSQSDDGGAYMRQEV